MKKRAKRKTLAKASLAPGDKVPLSEHIKELRRRLFYVAACVAVGSVVAYALERKLIAILLRPSHGQNFIYTSPLGGVNFLFGICLDIGLVVATPVIIYQLLAFIQPLMRDTTRKFLVFSSAAAGLVAAGGVAFGYFIGLPSALHFLLHQFVGVQIRPLITIQSYISFVGLYLFGSALMFQLPLILLFINRIKPLTPSGLFKYERHLILFAFITAFIMNPTPNIVDQLIVVVPIIIMYQLGIALIWIINRRSAPTKVALLREEDMRRQALRVGREVQAPTLPSTHPIASPVARPVASRSQASRPQLARATPRRTNYAAMQTRLVQ